MLKTNAEKEVLYIFLWLVGIILFYTLVHTFILEDSSNKTKKNSAKNNVTHYIQNLEQYKSTLSKNIKTNEMATKNKISNTSKPEKVEKLHSKSKVLEMPIKDSLKSASSHNNTISISIENKSIKIPKIPSVSKVVDVPSVTTTISTAITPPRVENK